MPHRPRPYGESTYTFSKLVTHTFNMVTGFSTLPLQAASALGFLLTLVGLALLFYIIVVRIILFGYDVPGFTFLASIVALFAGAQMFVLGIIGEYLARMHFRCDGKTGLQSWRQQVGDNQADVAAAGSASIYQNATREQATHDGSEPRLALHDDGARSGPVRPVRPAHRNRSRIAMRHRTADRQTADCRRSPEPADQNLFQPSVLVTFTAMWLTDYRPTRLHTGNRAGLCALNRRTAIVLLLGVLLIVVLAALLLLDDGAPQPVTPASGSDETFLPAFRTAQVQRLTLTRLTAAASADNTAADNTDNSDGSAPSGPTDSITYLRADNTDWAIAGRLLRQGEAVIQQTVESAIAQMTQWRTDNAFTVEGDLSPYGLMQPTYQLTLQVMGEADGQPRDAQLLVGRRNPAGDRYYMLNTAMPGTVFLVGSAAQVDAVLRLIDNPPLTAPTAPTPVPQLDIPGVIFRDFVADDIVQVRYSDAAGTGYTLDRTAAGWIQTATAQDGNTTAVTPSAVTMDAPSPDSDDNTTASVDSDEVTLLLNALASIEAVDAIDGGDPAALQLDPPRQTITASNRAGRVYTLAVGAVDATGTRIYTLVDNFDTVAVLQKSTFDLIQSLLERILSIAP